MGSKKSFFILLILPLLLFKCTGNEVFLELQKTVKENSQKVEKNSAILDTLKIQSGTMGKKISNNSTTLEEKSQIVEHMSAEISNLKNEISEMNNFIAMQQEIIDSLMQKEKDGALPNQEKNVPQQLFQNAMNLYSNSEYQASITKFTQFLEKYPDDFRASGAQFWIGKCYISLEQFQTAIHQMDKVLTNYPNAKEIVDAQLEIAYCLEKTEQYKGALSLLQQIQNQFPDYEKMDVVIKKIEELSEGSAFGGKER